MSQRKLTVIKLSSLEKKKSGGTLLYDIMMITIVLYCFIWHIRVYKDKPKQYDEKFDFNALIIYETIFKYFNL